MTVAFIGLLLLSNAYAVSSTAEDTSIKPKATALGENSNPAEKAPSSLPISAVPTPAVGSIPSLPKGVSPTMDLNNSQNALPLGNGPLSMAQVDALFATSISEFIYKLRDPFKMPEAEIKAAEVKSDLERYGLNEFKLVGILTGPKHMRAMLLAPDGKTYFVAKKAKIGTAGGIVHHIDPDGILIREKVVNAIGEVENMDSTIKMAGLDKSKGSSKGQSGMMQG